MSVNYVVPLALKLGEGAAFVIGKAPVPGSGTCIIRTGGRTISDGRGCLERSFVMPAAAVRTWSLFIEG